MDLVKREDTSIGAQFTRQLTDVVNRGGHHGDFTLISQGKDICGLFPVVKVSIEIEFVNTLGQKVSFHEYQAVRDAVRYFNFAPDPQI